MKCETSHSKNYLVLMVCRYIQELARGGLAGVPSAVDGGEWYGVAIGKPGMRSSAGSLICEGKLYVYKMTWLHQGKS